MRRLTLALIAFVFIVLGAALTLASCSLGRDDGPNTDPFDGPEGEYLQAALIIAALPELDEIKTPADASQLLRDIDKAIAIERKFVKQMPIETPDDQAALNEMQQCWQRYDKARKPALREVASWRGGFIVGPGPALAEARTAAQCGE